jgi:hypothetical protein
MNRWSTLLWTLVIVVATFMLYKVKYEVQSLQAQVAETAKALEQEKEALHVVAAEWAYLNRPERLQQLSAKHLSSAGVTVDQIAEIEAIPFPSQLQAAAEAPSNIQPAALEAHDNIEDVE